VVTAQLQEMDTLWVWEIVTNTTSVQMESDTTSNAAQDSTLIPPPITAIGSGMSIAPIR